MIEMEFDLICFYFLNIVENTNNINSILSFFCFFLKEKYIFE